MTRQEKRRRQWEKLIRKWKADRLDRQSWQIGNLDGESGTVVDRSNRPVAERVEYLRRFCWMNYEPDALYGRLERVYSIGCIPPAQVPHRGGKKKKSRLD